MPGGRPSLYTDEIAEWFNEWVEVAHVLCPAAFSYKADVFRAIEDQQRVMPLLLGMNATAPLKTQAKTP